MDEQILRALVGAPVSESTARTLVYGAEACARAFSLWETGHINANAQRPWREEYQAAVRDVSPALDRNTTMDELVAAYYDAALHADVARACQLADGRILNYATVEDAAFWQRYLAITGPDGARPHIND